MKIEKKAYFDEYLPGDFDSDEVFDYIDSGDEAAIRSFGRERYWYIKNKRKEGIKKVQEHRKDTVIKESYDRVMNVIKAKSASMSKFTYFAAPCKGTDEMRKRMQAFKTVRRG